MSNNHNHYLHFYYDSIRTLNSVFRKVYFSHFFDIILDYIVDYYNFNEAQKQSISKELRLLSINNLDFNMPYHIREIARSTMIGTVYMGESPVEGEPLINAMVIFIIPEAQGILCEIVDDISFKIGDVVSVYDYKITDVIREFMIYTSLDREFAIKVADEILDVMW